MNKTVFVIGTAVVDITALPIPEAAKWQEKQRISQIRLAAGGDGANQSVRLADLRMGAYLFAAVGADSNGLFLRSSLSERGVHTEYLSEHPEYPTGTSLVLVDAAGRRSTFSVLGAHSALAKEDLPTAAPELPVPDAISIASLFSLPALEEDGLAEYLAHYRNAHGTKVFADLGSDKQHQGLDGIRRFLPLIDYFLPSDYDALRITGKAGVEDAAAVLHACGCKNIVIKCGEKGCYFSGESGSGYVPALPVTPVDTTGAGDCMAALFLAETLKGAPLGDACTYACRGASLSTLEIGAQHPMLTDKMIQNGTI